MSPPAVAVLTPVPATVRVAQAVAITASAFLCGQTAAASYQLVPSIMEAPAPLLARQWRKAYEVGKAAGVPLIGGCTLLFAWLASREPRNTIPYRLYATAAVLVPTQLPYSFVFLKGTNEKLLAKADSLATASLEDTAVEAGVASEETVHAMVDKWASFNLGRALLSGMSAVCAVWATLGRMDVITYTA